MYEWYEIEEKLNYLNLLNLDEIKVKEKKIFISSYETGGLFMIVFNKKDISVRHSKFTYLSSSTIHEFYYEAKLEYYMFNYYYGKMLEEDNSDLYHYLREMDKNSKNEIFNKIEIIEERFM